MTKRLFIVAACAAIFGVAVHAEEAALTPGEFYTQVNLWVEYPKPMPTTNYHVGEIVPIGSKVKMSAVAPRAAARDIVFVYNGREFTIRMEPKHTKVGIDALKARTFGATNPLESETFKALAEEEQTAVKAGRVVVGMTKPAVLMAYGYPPEHETPTTEGNFWKFWYNRFTTRTVTFTDGKVSATAGF